MKSLGWGMKYDEHVWDNLYDATGRKSTLQEEALPCLQDLTYHKNTCLDLFFFFCLRFILLCLALLSCFHLSWSVLRIKKSCCLSCLTECRKVDYSKQQKKWCLSVCDFFYTFFLSLMTEEKQKWLIETLTPSALQVYCIVLHCVSWE